MPQEVFPRFQRLISVIKDAVFLATLIVAIASFVGTVAMSLLWPYFIEKLQEDLDVATKADLLKFQEQVNRISGEDRIIRMPSGHTYVAEPVSKDEPIELTLVMARTNHGSECNFVSGTPLFTDDRGVPFAGAIIDPIKQLGTNLERLHLTLNPPAALEPGRVGLVIAMKFSCPFGPNSSFMEAYDESDIIFFQMDPLSD